jgi:hypothetical protein
MSKGRRSPAVWVFEKLQLNPCLVAVGHAFQIFKKPMCLKFMLAASFFSALLLNEFYWQILMLVLPLFQTA